MNVDCCHWEGCELNSKPFGFGLEDNEEDNLMYEGFVFEGKKVCVGKNGMSMNITVTNGGVGI